MPKRKSPQLPLEQYEPGQYPPGGFVRTEEYPNGVHVRANGRPDPRKGKLTGRQETFCRLIVEGILSNAECARQSGYSAETAGQYATKLLNGQDFPHVVERITEMREERQRRYGVTTIGQLERLAKLSKGAEDAGQFGKDPFATLFCSFSGFCVDRFGSKTMDRGPRSKVRRSFVDVGCPARRCAWTLCADRVLRAVNLGPARGCPAPCAPFLLLIIEKRPEDRGPRASWPRPERCGRGLATQVKSTTARPSSLAYCMA
jgi:hypothetical protein